MFTNLHVYWFTFLPVYKNNIFQKTEKNEQKRGGGIGCDIAYLTTPASLNFQL